MTRRDLCTLGVRAAAVAAAAPMINRGRFAAAGGAVYSTRAIDLVSSALVVDMLGLPTFDWAAVEDLHTGKAEFTAADFAAIRESRVGAIHPAVELPVAEPYRATLEWMAGWNRFLDRNGIYFRRVDCAGDLTAAHREGKLGVLLGMQNSEHFRTAADVQTFHRLGQRVSQLTYNSGNRLGGGCNDRQDTGLTAFGAAIVGEMNQAGMAIDVSHAGERTTLDTIDASPQPVLVTHSNCRALSPHPRCKSDEVIRALARKGGVMGITAVRAFIGGPAYGSLDSLLNHFDHVASIAGIEHIGIGSDTALLASDIGSPAGRFAGAFDQPQRIYSLTEGLCQRTYSNSEILAILGGNFRRVLGEVLG